MHLDRRQFLKTTLASAAALTAPGAANSLAQAAPVSPGKVPALIDTNVHLFDWPFRHLKYSRTPDLVAKLRRHRVKRAWAGTYEGLFSKDLSGANARLVEECRRHGPDFLLPVGSVNPLWPGWEEDLRRCHEVHGMKIVRLHPGYQGFALDSAEFAAFLAQATRRGLRVQIALEMEDDRVHHPLVRVPDVSPLPLVDLLKKLPEARVQLLHGSLAWQRIPQARPLLEYPNLVYDISSIEGVGAVGRILEGRHWNLAGTVPLDRLLFGSHAPYFPLENALLKMFESPLSLPQLQAIMEDNARRFLG